MTIYYTMAVLSSVCLGSAYVLQSLRHKREQRNLAEAFYMAGYKHETFPENLLH